MVVHPHSLFAASTVAFTTLAFTSLLAIVNPLSAVPLYVTATADLNARQRASTLRIAVATGVVALVLFGLAGTFIAGRHTLATRGTVRVDRRHDAPVVGRTGMNVMTRLMGLIVMVVGVQFTIEGVRTVAVDILGR